MKKITSLFCIFLIFSLFSISVTAQQYPQDSIIVEGNVIDYENRNAIEETFICLIMGSIPRCEEYSNYSDSNGAYLVYDRSSHDIRGRIDATKEGYLRYYQTIDASDGDGQYLNIELSKEDSFDLNAQASVMIYGQIRDYETHEPIPDAHVKAKVTANSCDNFYEGAETYTDENGNYEIWIKPNYYSIWFGKSCDDKEYHYESYVFSKHFEPDETVKKDATLIYELHTEGGGVGDGDIPANDTPGFGAAEIFSVVCIATLFFVGRRKN